MVSWPLHRPIRAQLHKQCKELWELCPKVRDQNSSCRSSTSKSKKPILIDWERCYPSLRLICLHCVQFLFHSFFRRDRKMDSQNAVQVDETQRQQETVSRNYLWQCTSEYGQYMFNAEKFRAGLFLLYSTTVFSWVSKIITWDCLRFALLCVLFGSGNSHLIDRNWVHFFGREICLYLVWIFDDSLQYLTLSCLAFWFCYL